MDSINALGDATLHTINTISGNKQSEEVIEDNNPQELDTHLDYSDKMQIEILIMLIRDPDFAALALPKLQPSYFSKNLYAYILVVLQDFYKQYESLPTSPETLLDHFKDVALTNRKLEFNANIEIFATQMFNKDVAINSKMVIAKTEGFLKKVAMKNALWDGVHLLDKGKIGAIVNLVNKASEVSFFVKCNLTQYLNDKYRRDSQREGMLGYPLNKFKAMEKHLDGLQKGLYLVGAETNLGKTAFLTNLCLDILDTNPETCLVYFSLDDKKDVVINRFLSIQTQISINEVQKKQPTDIAQELVERANENLIRYAEEGRLQLYDTKDVRHISDIEATIKANADKNLIVIVDALYNLEVNEKSKGLREDNIDRANNIKRLTEIYNIPIILTGELRKKQKNKRGEYDDPGIEDLMETGKYAYNADVVFLIYPADRDAYDAEEDPIIVLKYAKNKLSSFRGWQNIRFSRSQGRFQEEYRNTDSTAEMIKKVMEEKLGGDNVQGKQNLSR